MADELELKIKEIITRTPNVRSVRLETTQRLDFKAGQYLIVTLNKAKALTKPLSISNSPTEEGYIEFTKKITESEFSKTLCSLKPQDMVTIKYPFGNFTLNEEYKKIAFLSGGIGITPVRSITKYASDKKLDIDIVLIYANRTVEDIAFKQDFDIIQKEYSQLKVIHILSQVKTGWSGRTGRISSQVIKEEIPDYPQRRFYICGPPLMVDAMKGCLLYELNVAGEFIITEDFKGY